MNEPKVVSQALAEGNALIQKGISASNLASETIGSGLITPQNLSSLLPNLAGRKTSFYDRVRKPRGFGQASEFNTISALFGSGESADPRELFYADGGKPEEKSTTYSNVVNPYRDLGLSGSVTGRAMRQAQGGTPADLEAQEVQNTMTRVRQAIDWLAFWSRDDVNNSNGIAGFKGLDQLITTNVIDAGGASISKALIDQASTRIAYQGGEGELTHIFTSVRVGVDLDNIYNTQQQLVVNMGDTRNDLTLGNRVTRVATVAGEAELVSSYFLNPGTPYTQGQPYSASSGVRGISLSSVFLLSMNWVEYEELLPMSKVDLAVVADKMDFMIINSGTIKVMAEPWCAKIINVAETTFE